MRQTVAKLFLSIPLAHAFSVTSTPPLLVPGALETISRGGVHIAPNWLPPELLVALRTDAESLHASGHFSPDGLTNAAKARTEQGFSARADRQVRPGGRVRR